VEEGQRRYTVVWNPNKKEYQGLGFLDRLDNFPFTKLGKLGQPQGETNDALGLWAQEKCLDSFGGIKSALERLRNRYNAKPVIGSGPSYERRQQVKQDKDKQDKDKPGGQAASAPPPSVAADFFPAIATLQQLLQSQSAVQQQMPLRIDQQAGVVIHPPPLTPLSPSPPPPHPTSPPSHPLSPHLTPPQ
jgi:hypothetical protein